MAVDLKRERERCNLTQQRLAKLVGVSQQAVCAYENNTKRPSVEIAKKIAATLGIKWTAFYEE